MNAPEAQRVIESLRKGIPPDGYVRQFTVGRASEVDQLTSRLHAGEPGALLIKANYGSGKTHLLRFLRETALGEGFVVSYISLDTKSAVRFDRMDRILGAIVRNIECAGYPGKGPATLFSAVLNAMTSPCPDVQRRARLDELSSTGRWDYSKVLEVSGSLCRPARVDHQHETQRSQGAYPSSPEKWKPGCASPGTTTAKRHGYIAALLLTFDHTFAMPVLIGSSAGVQQAPSS